MHGREIMQSRSKQWTVGCVCLHEWVCFRHVFVICYFMLACSHTSGFPPFCGFLVCVDDVYFG